MQVNLEKKLFILGKKSELVDFFCKPIEKNKSSQIILPCSLNDLALLQNNDFYDSVDFCTSDSMWLTRFFNLRYLKSFDRVYGPDLMLSVLSIFNKTKSKQSHCFVCADQETFEKMQRVVAHKYPKLHAKYFCLPKIAVLEKKCLRAVIQAKSKFIWLGIGSPKQLELAAWLKENSTETKIFCVGAAFSFMTGKVKQAPILMQRIGLEWLWRLLVEPRRLWRRYLIIIPKYLVKMLGTKLLTFIKKIKL